MLKSGAILAVVSLVLALGVTTLCIPACVPCVGLLLGLGAGLLTGALDRPSNAGKAAKAGAGAGALGGIGAIVGQMLGAGVNGVIVGPEGAAQLLEQLGIEAGTNVATDAEYWLGVTGGALCLSALDIVFIAALGALGCLAWRGLVAGNREPPASNEEAKALQSVI
jgi:hypothetical protein